MTDLMTRLAQARPTGTELAALWPAERRQAVFDRVTAGAATAPPRHRLRTGWIAAAAAVTCLGTLPAVLDSSDAAANDLLALAAAAERTGWEEMAPGTYLHVRTEEVQRNSRIFGNGRVLDTNREKWMSWDGQTWAIDTRPSEGWAEYHVFERPGEPEFSSPTPEFAASLPDDPETLGAYLREHVSGSNSHQEALYVAVTDLARSGYLPAETLAAALMVLADVDGVETEDVVVDGRAAVAITWSQWWGDLLGTDSVVLDRDTAMVLRVSSSDPGGTYELTTTLIEVVDEIPANVEAAFERRDDANASTSDPMTSSMTTAASQVTGVRPTAGKAKLPAGRGRISAVLLCGPLSVKERSSGWDPPYVLRVAGETVRAAPPIRHTKV